MQPGKPGCVPGILLALLFQVEIEVQAWLAACAWSQTSNLSVFFWVRS